MNVDDSLPLSLEQEQDLDRVCSRFESACKSETPPRIEDHLVGLADVSKPVVLRELILLDVFYRRRQATPARTDEYREPRFPDVSAA